MKRANPKTAWTIGAVLGGGLVAGAIVAFSISPTMKRSDIDTMAALSPRSIAVDDGFGYAVEAPPQDAMPVGWDSSGPPYPSTATTNAWSAQPEQYVYDDAVPPYDDETALTDVNLIDDMTRPDRTQADDAAAASAQAASAAAEAVRAAESAATKFEADANDLESGQPAATSGTS